MRLMTRAARAALAGAAALFTSGCGFFVPDYVHTEWRDAVTTSVLARPEQPREMVGLALSGGGTRAAVFAATAIEELDRLGIAEKVTHLSSVTGGAFASTCHEPPPPPDCATPQCRADHFATFRETLRSNLGGATFRRQLTNPGRFTSPTRRSVSLKESLDAAFLEGATFGDLPRSPALLINAARYTDGRRFVFSNLALPDEAYDHRFLSQPALRAASFSRPGCPRPAPDAMPLSFAVAASASFPLFFGPVTLEAPVDCAGTSTEYWHFGDGGVIENLGTETLREIVLRAALEGRPFKRVTILSMDGEQLHTPAEMLQQADVGIWTSNPGIVVDTTKTRARAYAELIWERIARELGVEIKIVRMRYTDSQLTEWPESCAVESRSGVSILAHLKQIATGLSISDCDADLMEAAARDLVRRNLGTGELFALN